MNREHRPIEERVAELEVRQRRWKVAGLIMVVSTAAFAVVGQRPAGQHPRIIEAERFVLRDVDGSLRAALAMGETGAPGLVFFNRNTRIPQLIVGTLGDGEPTLQMNDSHGEKRALITAGDALGPKLELFGTTGVKRISLSATRDSAALIVADHAGKASVSLMSDKGGLSGVLLLKDGVAGVGTFTVAERGGRLVLFDAQGRITFTAPESR